MRLSRIKSCLFGFTVILISIFCCNSKVLAQNNVYFNYSDFEELLNNSDSVYKESINDLLTYLEKYENDYYVFVYFNTSLDSTGNLRTLSTLGFKLIPKNDYIQTNVGLKFESNNYVSIGNSNNNTYGDNAVVSQTSGSFSSSYGFFFNYDFDTYIAGLDTKIESANFTNKSYSNFTPIGFNINSENTADFSQGVGVYIYSNFDFNFVSTDYNVIFDSKMVSNGHSVISYHDYLNNKSKIKLSASLAQDLTGTEFYNISAEFDEIYDSTYTYQYKINDDEWVDINTIHLNENSSRVFNYSAYFNMNMYFRVLDSENNVLDENSITISKLSDYGMIISHNFAQDINGRDIYSIMVDLRSCWNANYTYQYSYDNEKYYDMTGISADNQIFYLNHGINVPIYFRILNENSEVDWSRHYNEDFPLVDKKIVVNEFTRMLDGTKMIGVQFDLSQYTQFTWDEYNLTIFINGTQQDIKDQITFNYYEADFDNFTYNVVLKLDNLVIEEFTYELNPEGKEFDDRYEQILEENLEKELGENDYSTVGGMVDSLNSFIEAVKDFIKSFFDLAFGFFNELNIWIRTFIIGIFIVMVICKIIKVVRK